jgi:hypothetical protein
MHNPAGPAEVPAGDFWISSLSACTGAPAQVAAEAGELRGGLRFLAALLKERLLPLALVHTAVTDLAGRTVPGPASLHSQPLVALALASLLQARAGPPCST